MPIGKSDKTKPSLSVPSAKAFTRVRPKSESSASSSSRLIQRSSPSITISRPPSKAQSDSTLSVNSTKSVVSASSVLTPVTTRSVTKMAQSRASAALVNFIAVTNRVSQFEARFNTPSGSAGAVPPSRQTCKIRLDQVRALWEKVEQEYETCSSILAGEETDETMSVIQSKYDYCYSVYESCAAQLSEQIEATTPRAQQAAPTVVSSGCRLPPCDTGIFSGDYLRWPTFRDLFTAIYINNSRLTDVEKLFHLNSKTSGEAHDIVSKSPLTNDGFVSAWSNLTQRFENKRLLVNSQLKVLFDLPNIPHESGAAIKNLQSTIQSCLTALEISKVKTENWDCLLVFLCSSKLPKLTLSLWEQSLHGKTDIVSWAGLDSFLQERYRTLEAIEDIKPSSTAQTFQKSKKDTVPPKRIQSFENKVNIKPQSCKLCSKENHPIRLCPQFLQMSVPDRCTYIKQQKLCLNCFARQHQVAQCTSIHNCFTCKGRHNTLLHRGVNPQIPAAPSSSANPATPANSHHNIQSTSSSNVQNYFTSNSQNVLLGTAVINICHRGTCFKARALIDSGSEATFISERMFNIVKPFFQNVHAQVAGLNQAVAAKPEKLCHFDIGSPSKPRIKIEASAFVLPHLAGNLPSYPIPSNFVNQIPDLPLADPSFYRSSQIDVLIGADILPAILLGGSRSNICGSLLGQETIFGWILSGPVKSPSNSTVISAFTTRISVSQNQKLENLLTRFWEVEDLPSKMVKKSDSDCECNFVRTTTRNNEGRYVVTLPFKTPDSISLGHSRSIALSQFLRSENRFKKNPELKLQYDSVLQEYLDLGHMREVPPSNDSDNFYLPHHAVLKPDSTTTKLRVVFNASSPSSNGQSLNDVLHPGPVLQSDLTIQIIKWRFFRYVFNSCSSAPNSVSADSISKQGGKDLRL